MDMNGMMAFGWLGFLLGIALLLLSIISIMHLVSNYNGASNQALSAAEKRYARGEIGREEFEDIKRTLG